MSDRMTIEVLEDGTISVTTDGISGTNHVSADKFLDEIEKLSCGKRESRKRKGFAHSHDGIHVHTH